MANPKSNSALDEKVNLEVPQQNSSAHSRSSGEAFAKSTGINEKALVRKLDLKLLPPLTLLHSLSFLDRGNSKYISIVPPASRRNSSPRPSSSSSATTSAEAQLLSVPLYAAAFVLTITTAVLSEKTRRRSPFTIGSATLAIVGYITLLTAPINKPGVSYADTILAAAGIYPSTAIVLSWAAANVSGHSKRATATAMTITIANLGAVLGTQLYRPNTSPRRYLGHGFALGLPGRQPRGHRTVLWALLTRENRHQVARQQAREGVITSDEDDKQVSHFTYS
ncbi:uncharacterized protein L3040_008220 [Drepanopeziza brunnea f. sp. 'multigermtubi']|uniref:uncharacterized protein n=1 Tax=Drepanopeziza brunnea f. sp. 'multigermtubi' TaxID=698441 RepID=UPI002382D0AE|nr:hypothetical protein L3040_008220 [Drepanopeziza brunnea f. sp. 'multigermtubi']